MIIFEHAVDMYVERVLNEDPTDYSLDTRDDARTEIKKTFRGPDFKGVFEQGSSPIYIRGDVAFPVVMDHDDYDELVIPTVYNSDTFKKRME